MTATFTPGTDPALKARAQADAESAARRGHDLPAKAHERILDARRRIEAIRDDERLSGDAKSADIARLTAETNAHVQALRAEHEASLHRRRDELRRRLCTPTAHATGAERVAIDASFRDALERAGRTEPREGMRHPLMDLFHSAHLVSDTLQQRAALVTALERNDIDVMNAWIEAHPEDDKPMNELYQLHHELTDVRARFSRSMQFVTI